MHSLPRSTVLWVASLVAVQFVLLQFNLSCAVQEETATHVDSLDTESSDVPPPEYYPEDNRVGSIAGGVGLTADDMLDQFQARRDAVALKISASRTPSAWRAAIARHVSPETVAVIARVKEDLGADLGPDRHAVRIDVLEQIFGPGLRTATLVVVQDGENGLPSACGGIHWPAAREIAVVLTPSKADTYRVLGDVGDHVTLGWAVRTTVPTQYATRRGVIIERSDLAALEGGGM